ncbi:WxL protein peptidoglycan domain-containing protein [Bombilactobacillus thymidiniphilus]|uniref:DUF916 and DUF3324 domain-containing protein n=1 Tax=Bombilactobacillus thymidiniphilus TaxID=2923363 RepID=A0ABY4PCH8_9LACO|nr:DUF916 domain-containing protein [Bombilactobacillus thymidiniphilus]UQS83211.1 DUF916 and DUF3324 domain-containing protein [Bombilactobacillus thymidiniphilus]
MKKIRLFLFAILFCTLFIFTNRTIATQASTENVSVTPIIDNSDITDHFQIIAKPNRMYQVKLSITNFGVGSVKLRVRPTNASTSTEGTITYQQVISSGQNGLRYAFKDMTQAKNVTLAPNQTKEIAFNIKTPAKSFTGLMMGGFYIYDLSQPSSPGLKVPVWLTEDNKAVGGVLVLSDVSAEVVQKKPFINVNLSNNQPGSMKNVTVHMNLKRKGLLELLHLGFKPVNVDQTYKNIAPNSTVPVAFDQQSLPVKPGIYQATGTARSGKTHWRFSGSYRITQTQADRVNKASSNLIPDRTVMYLMIVLALLLLIFFVVWGLWSQSRQQKTRSVHR